MLTETLQARSTTGKEQPWEEMKVNNELLSQGYLEVNPDKAERLKTCANTLTKLVFPDGTTKIAAWFCHVRLCPMCSWRRSLKVAAQMHAIMEAIKEKEDKPYVYIMLTLTQPNCLPEQLADEITRVLRAFSNLTKLTDFKKAIFGFYRAMEVTHNLNEDTYHPHIHAILAVQPSYFKSRNYISQARWSEMWRDCLGLTDTPIVHIQKVKGDTAKAVAEVAKYAVKSKDYIIPDDWELTVDSIRTLDTALNGRKFLSFGGIFRKWHKLLHLPDIEKTDLSDEINEPLPDGTRVVHYAWYSGYRQYGRVD